MEKYKLVSLVKKFANYFDNHQNPNLIYKELWNDTYIKEFFNTLLEKDILLFCFLLPLYLNGKNIDEIYDIIEHTMFSVELVEIYDTDVETKCEECGGGGYVPCNRCDGFGDVDCRSCDGTGEEDCEYCDGSGVDEEGETCDTCDGSGKVVCYRCNGRTRETCGYCGGDGEVNCLNCNAAGTINNDDDVEVQYLGYVSWNNRWKEYFFNMKPDQQLDDEDARNFHNNSQTIYLGMYEQITEEYSEYENGDIILFDVKDTKKLYLQKSNDGLYL
jgi:hypothetical protein